MYYFDWQQKKMASGIKGFTQKFYNYKFLLIITVKGITTRKGGCHYQDTVYHINAIIPIITETGQYTIMHYK